MILMVSYDLHNPGRDYDRIIATLKTAPGYIHPQGSVWILDTSLPPLDWRNKLQAVGDPNDEYFVVRLQHDWAGAKMSQAEIDWLKSSSRSW